MVMCVCACQLVTVKQTSVTKKKDSLRAMALDSDNNQIQVRDVVKVVDGPHSVGSCLFDLPILFSLDISNSLQLCNSKQICLWHAICSKNEDTLYSH